MGRSIFEKVGSISPAAMATVAERRFGDAKALADTNDNARANGVLYLSGFVIEILLKVQLVKRYPHIAKKSPDKLTDSERDVWRLIWRQHDLALMLKLLPQLQTAIKVRSERRGENYFDDLKKISASWSIYARYSPHAIQMKEAQDWLRRVRSLKELLK